MGGKLEPAGNVESGPKIVIAAVAHDSLEVRDPFDEAGDEPRGVPLHEAARERDPAQSKRPVAVWQRRGKARAWG